jgi:hypothetical protein
MHVLRGERLEVQVLDPRADRGRLGSRYCTGGYIVQVTDGRHGSLLAGPQWPAEAPDVFHGQGAPEAFNGFPGAEGVPPGGEVGVMGVGMVRRASAEPFQPRTSRDVSRWVEWSVNAGPAEISMSAEQRYGEWAYRLAKTVRVSVRTVRSQSSMENLGRSPLPVRWFAHPFFPLPAGRRLFRSNIPFTLPASPGSPGFDRDSQGWFCRREDHDWPAGCFCQLGFDPAASRPLELEQEHPLVGRVTVRTDFAPTSFPIWGNDRTFSVEPYWEHTIEPGGRAGWAIEYTFAG